MAIKKTAGDIPKGGQQKNLEGGGARKCMPRKAHEESHMKNAQKIIYRTWKKIGTKTCYTVHRRRERKI
jgi:hypothetical protein